MLTAPRPESVRETQRVLFPDLVENPPYRVLYYFVFQRRDSQWSLPPIAFRDPSSPRRSRLIGPSMDAPVQVADSRLQAFSIRRFRSSIPSPHMPLSNASSAASRLPSHGSGSG